MKFYCIPVLFFCLFVQPTGAQTAPKPVFSNEVYFDFGQHDLRPQADSALLAVLQFTEGKENFTVKITAHTDSIGSLANNEALSRRRANAAKDFLVKNGIPANRISTATFGETKPAADNRSDEGRQRNRRVTVEVLQTLPMVVIEGTVLSEKTGKPLVADVVVRTKDATDTLRTGDDGYFKFTVAVGTVVGLDAYAKCHFMKSEMLKATSKPAPLKMPLKPAATGATADIGNLYFVGNQAILLEKSEPELPKILRFLQLNPAMKIEIAGHINLPNVPMVARNTQHFLLSEARARLVYDYLLENGIPADRISWKGYGNYEMRFPRAILEAEQALNRRVEIRVLEGGCE